MSSAEVYVSVFTFFRSMFNALSCPDGSFRKGRPSNGNMRGWIYILLEKRLTGFISDELRNDREEDFEVSVSDLYDSEKVLFICYIYVYM